MEPRSAEHQAFGRAIRELRKEKGLSQEALAHASDLDRSYMGGIERGEHNVALTNILRITDALGITSTALFERFEMLRQG